MGYIGHIFPATDQQGYTGSCDLDSVPWVLLAIVLTATLCPGFCSAARRCQARMGSREGLPIAIPENLKTPLIPEQIPEVARGA